MTDASDEFAEAVTELLDEFGAEGSIVIQNASYATGGGVTGTPVTLASLMAGPLDESKRYASVGAHSDVQGTFYVGGDIGGVPSDSDQIVFQGRTFVIYGMSIISLQGVTIAYQLDVGEIGNG